MIDRDFSQGMSLSPTIAWSVMSVPSSDRLWRPGMAAIGAMPASVTGQRFRFRLSIGGGSGRSTPLSAVPSHWESARLSVSRGTSFSSVRKRPVSGIPFSDNRRAIAVLERCQPFVGQAALDREPASSGWGSSENVLSDASVSCVPETSNSVRLFNPASLAIPASVMFVPAMASFCSP